MASNSVLLMVTVLLSSFLNIISSTHGHKFYVGGKDGWVVTPTEPYNHWAERNRFQVNDTLFFKYKKGSDSVLLVTREDYYSCNTSKPIQSFTDGDSIFTFDCSGPFFFIGGNADNCNKGQKLIVVVMAVRPKRPQQQPPSPSPSSAAAPPPPPSPPMATPPAESPRDDPSDLDAPTPAPLDHKSGSVGVVVLSSTWLVLGFSVWVSIVMGSF